MRISNFFRSALILLLVSVASVAIGQDWKSLYDNAIASYQGQQYVKALTEAKLAYDKSLALDAKNQAYTLQLITVICLESNLPDEGLNWIEKETGLYKQIEGTSSKTFAESLRKHALLLQQKGRLKDADAKCQEAIASFQNALGPKSLEVATLTCFHGQLLAALGDVKGAKETLAQGLPLLEAQPEGGEDYIAALTLAAQIDKRLNDLPGAEAKFKRLISLLESNQLTALPEYGEAKAALAEIVLGRGQSEESQKLLQGNDVQADVKAQQLLKIAVDLQNDNQLEKAADNYRAASDAATLAKLQNNTAFSIHLNYARVLTELNLLEKAGVELQSAAQLANSLYTASSPEHAFLSFATGDLLLKQRNNKGAIEAYQKGLLNSSSLALSIRARFLTHAAKLLLNESRPDAAVLLLQPIVTAGSSSSEKGMVEATVTYSEALILNNQSEQAVSLLSKAIVSAPNIDIKNQYEVELAEALENKGEWKKSLQLLQAIDLTPSLAPALRADNSFRMARLYQHLGDYTEAEKKFRASIETYRKLEPSQPDDLMRVYNSLAIFYTQLGNYTEAERLYTDLLKQTDTFSGFHTTLQQNLAGVYLETLRYEEAQKLLESVLKQDKERLGDHHPDFAISLQNLAAAYQKTDHLDKAKALYMQALAIDRENGEAQSIAYATKAGNLGVVLQESGDLTQAETLLQSALQIRESKLGKEHPDYVFNEYNLAVLYQQKGEIDKAESLFQHVSRFYQSQIRELFPAMSEKEKTAFYNKIGEVINAYQSFAVEQGRQRPALLGDLYNFRLATKALLLNASTKVRNRVLSSGDPVLLQQFAEWLQTKEELGKLYTLTAEQRQSSAARILALQQLANELEKALSARSELFARDHESELVDWKKIQGKLMPGEAAIEMIRLALTTKKDSTVYAALVLKPGLSQPEMIIFPNGKKMEGREFSFYRNSVRFQMHNERSYQVYWQPFEKILAGVNTVYFSADGVYNKVNILTFFNPVGDHYLLEQLTIKLVSNTKELLLPPKSASTIQTAALFGYPDYRLGYVPNEKSSQGEPSHTTRDYFSRGIPDLPGTETEVNAIGELLRTAKWGTTVFVGANASETKIKAQQNTGVLHIATHGFFIPVSDHDQAVVSSMDPAQAENNPLLRSGLMLSGAEKYLNEPSTEATRAEDGVLTAYEAINLNLDRTDLVILSACETGAGEVRNGEGVYGLQRAFLLAGANNILMSLWKVDDEATQELMVEFYNQWTRTKNKTEAFRNTQLEMKKRYEAPFFWGSFVMIGTN